MRWYRMECERGHRAGEKRVATFVRGEDGVRGVSAEGEPELRRRHQDAACDERAGWESEAEVEAHDCVEIVDEPRGCDRGGTTERTLLRRLEDETNRALQMRLEMGEDTGDAEPDRDMAIVAASMHLALGARAKSRDDRL